MYSWVGHDRGTGRAITWGLRGRGTAGTGIDRFLAVLLALTLALSWAVALNVAPAAEAQQPPGVVPNAGPIDLATGYPMWYEDQNRLRLELCVDDGTQCIGELENPDELPSVPDNWILDDAGLPGGEAEGFWWLATAQVTYPQQPGSSDAGRATLVLGKESTFAFENVAAGEQIAFGRLRIRLRGLQPNTAYTITHPYGVDVETTDERGRMEHQVSDIGCFDVPCDFTLPLDSRPMPYLRWDGTGAQPPDGWAAVLGVPHTVTGSPVGFNAFRVAGPGLPGGAVQTNLFDVQAKLWQTPSFPRLGFDSVHNVVPFGEQLDAEPLAATATITNVGNEPLVIGDPSIEGDPDFSIVENGCTQSVPLGGRCAIQLQFSASPGSEAGTRTANLVLASNDGLRPTQRLPLTALAVDPDAPRPVQGPIDPETGFPLWYEDAEGTRLDLCLDEGSVAGGDCLAVLPQPDQPPYVPGNFDPDQDANFDPETEAFYWHAEADMSDALPLPPGEEQELERAQLVLGLEAAFFNEELAQGDQIVFGRVRVRVTDLVPDETYTVTHPFGVDTFVAEDDGEGVGEINNTVDLGCANIPCDFARPLFLARTWPFLIGADFQQGDATIGNPNVPEPVTGAVPPGENVFRVEGAGLGDDGIETTAFSLQGRIWTRSAEPQLAINGRFGQVAFGRQVLPIADLTRTLTLTNAGSGTLNISNLEVVNAAGQPSADFQATGECSALAADGTCDVTIAFTPQSPGLKVAYLQTTSNDGTATVQRIRLSGNALEATEIPPEEPGSAPSTPVLTAESDTGASNSDRVTNDNTPTFTGTAATGDTVQLLVNGEVSGTAVAVNNTYTITSDLLADGVHTVAARVGDLTSGTISVTIDTAVPTAITFEGGPADGASYPEGSVPAAPTCTADYGLSGPGSCAVTGYGVTVGSHTMTATATDLAGNSDTATRTYSVTAVVVGPAPWTGGIPLTGDWNNDGTDTPGWFLNGRVWLKNTNGPGAPDMEFSYGRAGDVPVVGDWNNNNTDTIGIRRGREWHLRNSNTAGAGDIVFSYGVAGDTAIVGDWNSSGTDTVGVKRGRQWLLRNSNTSGNADTSFVYGAVGDEPVVGDWTNNNQDTIGIKRGREWHLRNTNTAGAANTVFIYGATGDLPVTGDWNDNGQDTVGVVRGLTWLLRNTNTAGAANTTFDF